MKIIEHFTKGKADQDILNEDCLVVTDDYIVLMDGVTSKLCPRINDKSGGRFAVEVAAEAIGRFAPDLTAYQAISLLSLSLREATEKQVKLSPQAERPAFGIIVYSRQRREIWRVGDLCLMMDGILHLNCKEVDRVASEARALMIEIFLRKGGTMDDISQRDMGREFIMPLLKEQHIFANQTGPYGFGVVNGYAVPEEFIQVFDAGQAKEIIFSSDGYPQLFCTLAASEGYLAAVLKEDPLLFKKYKSTKGLQAGNISFDDRTYVRFQVGA